MYIRSLLQIAARHGARLAAGECCVQHWGKLALRRRHAWPLWRLCVTLSCRRTGMASITPSWSTLLNRIWLVARCAGLPLCTTPAMMWRQLTMLLRCCSRGTAGWALHCAVHGACAAWQGPEHQAQSLKDYCCPARRSPSKTCKSLAPRLCVRLAAALPLAAWRQSRWWASRHRPQHAFQSRLHPGAGSGADSAPCCLLHDRKAAWESCILQTLQGFSDLA